MAATTSLVMDALNKFVTCPGDTLESEIDDVTRLAVRVDEITKVYEATEEKLLYTTKKLGEATNRIHALEAEGLKLRLLLAKYKDRAKVFQKFDPDVRKLKDLISGVLSKLESPCTDLADRMVGFILSAAVKGATEHPKRAELAWKNIVEENEKLTSGLKHCKAQNQRLITDRCKRREEIQRLTQKCENVEFNLQNCTKELTKTESKMIKYRSDCKIFAAKNDEYKTLIEEKQDEIDTIRETNEHIAKEVKRISADNIQFQRDLREQRETVKKLSREEALLIKKLEDVREENKILKHQQENFDEKYETKQRQHETMLARVHEITGILEEEKSKMKQIVGAHNKEIDAHNKEIDKCNKKVDAMQDTIYKLIEEKKLHTLQSARLNEFEKLAKFLALPSDSISSAVTNGKKRATKRSGSSTAAATNGKKKPKSRGDDVAVVSNEDLWGCVECGEYFGSENEYAKHECVGEKAPEKWSGQCKRCGKTFTSKGPHDRHVKSCV